MLTVTIANFIAIILAASGRLFRKEKTMLLVAAIVLTLFYSVRTDYGNDIPAYKYLFDMVSSASFSDLLGIQERTEPGWMILNYLFVPLGSHSFIRTDAGQFVNASAGSCNAYCCMVHPIDTE